MRRVTNALPGILALWGERSREGERGGERWRGGYDEGLKVDGCTKGMGSSVGYICRRSLAAMSVEVEKKAGGDKLSDVRRGRR